MAWLHQVPGLSEDAQEILCPALQELGFIRKEDDRTGLGTSGDAQLPTGFSLLSR